MPTMTASAVLNMKKDPDDVSGPFALFLSFAISGAASAGDRSRERAVLLDFGGGFRLLEPALMFDPCGGFGFGRYGCGGDLGFFLGRLRFEVRTQTRLQGVEHAVVFEPKDRPAILLVIKPPLGRTAIIIAAPRSKSALKAVGCGPAEGQGEKADAIFRPVISGRAMCRRTII
jgi:hypothetical protein